MVVRTYLLLVRHGVIESPPPELAGQNVAVEYVGPLALALRDQQAQGFITFTDIVGGISETYPQALDIPNYDKGLRHVGRSLGVSTEHMATEEEVAAKREQRAEAEARQEELAALEVGAKGYKQVREAPEEGSPADKLVSAMER